MTVLDEFLYALKSNDVASVATTNTQLVYEWVKTGKITLSQFNKWLNSIMIEVLSIED